MSIEVYIDGELKNPFIRAGAEISIQKSLGESATASLDSFSLDGEIQTITGDGVLRQFTLSRIPSNTPSLDIGGIPQDVGIYGVDTGKDWYWERGTTNIYQDAGGTTLPNLTTMGADLGTYYPSVGQPLLIRVSSGVAYQITGDGSTQVFSLPQVASQLLSVVYNSSLPQTFGIWGVDTGKQWYLDLETNEVKQEPGDPALAGGVTLDVAYDYWVDEFGGIIRSVERRKPYSSSPLLECTIQATDYNHILERRLTASREWLGVDDNDIAQALVDDYLTDEGVTLSTGSPVTVDQFRVAYDTVAGALAALCQITGKQALIDASKTLTYKLPSASAAPFSIPSGASNIATLSVTETDEDYCNVVVVKSGKTIRAEQTEELPGDGAATSFELAYPVASVPTISIGGILQTVGITGVDTGKDWYWQQGSKEIRQDIDGVPLSSADILTVTYAGIEEAYITSENADEIAARAAKEGTSGRYEKLFETDRLQSVSDAKTMADGILAERSTVPLKAVYTTNDYLEPEAKNLQPGQEQDILIDGWAAQQTGYRVRSVGLRSMGSAASSDWQFSYAVEAFYGSLTKTTFQWFRELGGGGTAAGSSAGNGGNDGNIEYIHFFLAGCDALSAGDDLAAQRPFLMQPGSVFEIGSDCKTAPTVDIEFNVEATRDGGTTWASILVGESATHTAGTTGVLFVTALSANAAALPKGTKFRVNVASGDGQGWALKLAVKRSTGAVGSLTLDGGEGSMALTVL